MTDTDYTPIDCGEYSRYELLIMHRQRLRLTWRDSAGLTRVDHVLPTDLRTRRGEEFLIIRTSEDQVQEIRLDRILSAEPV